MPAATIPANALMATIFFLPVSVAIILLFLCSFMSDSSDAVNRVSHATIMSPATDCYGTTAECEKRGQLEIGSSLTNGHLFGPEFVLKVRRSRDFATGEVGPVGLR